MDGPCMDKSKHVTSRSRALQINGARHVLTWSTLLVTPRARCDGAQQQVSLSRDRGYRTRRSKETSQRCCKQRGNLHNTNSRLCPNESMRLSSSPICYNKGLNVWCDR